MNSTTTTKAIQNDDAGTERRGVMEGVTRTDRCVFCEIIDGDAPVNLVDEGKMHVAFTPIGPHVPGHVLFVPRQHINDATVNPSLAAKVTAAAYEYVKRLGLQANVLTSIGAAATQSVMHLHVHVVPRGADDGLTARWPWITA